MAFIIQNIDGPRISLSEVKGRTLRIGRGTNAHLRSDNAAVALEHAYIEQSGEGYELFDKGSITGTYLNGRPVEASRLSKGDQIEIGDLRILVQIAEATRPLFLRVDRTADQAVAGVPEEESAGPASVAAAGPAGGVLKAPRVDYEKAYQLRNRLMSKRNLSILGLLIATIAIAMIFIKDRQDAFIPGSLSVAHAGAVLPSGERLIADGDCGACHEPFAGATDARCMACHKQAFHQAAFADLGACGSCHAEHRDIPRLAVVRQDACIDCHSDLTGRYPNANVAMKVSSFEKDHPQFRLRLDNQLVAVDETNPELKRDINSLKFNHRCHMVGDCNKRPPAAGETRSTAETLTCDSCHTVNTSNGRIEPLDYQTACARCHLLTFDNRFPPVPHRLELGTVAGVIANAYSGNTRLLNQSPEEVLRIFAARPPSSFDMGSATVRNARNVLRVRCIQCHELDSSGAKVIPPITHRQWFAGMSNFSHVDHLSESLELQCVDCHVGVVQSAATRDISMPGIKECTACHGAEGMAGRQTLGDCTTCHFYHELTTRFGPGWTTRAAGVSLASATLPSAAAPEEKGSSETDMGADTTLNLPIWLLVALIVIALLAFVAGATLVAWLSIRRKKKKAAHGAAPAAGPRTVVPPLPGQAPAPARPAAPPPAPAPAPRAPAAPPPRPAAPAPVDRTVAMPEPEGTMMVQWHGQIVGIGGLRSGDRFPVMDEGFYIGRDKTMSEVVIDSTEVSRRHVWIGLKEGKVMAVDQESTNGTFVNGTRIREVELKGGDEITLASGVSKLRYEP